MRQPLSTIHLPHYQQYIFSIINNTSSALSTVHHYHHPPASQGVWAFNKRTQILHVPCHQLKECRCNARHIICQGRSLTQVPQLVHAQTGNKYLDLETNSITSISAERLPSNLSDISLLRNPVTTIDVNAFDDSKDTLQSISLSEAQFTRIPDALLHLRVLSSFNIYDTFIQDWNTDVMKNISSTVETLYLVNVSLSSWPTWIQYFSHLMELSLHLNFISLIHDDALDMQANSLTILDLSSNNLTTVPKALSKLTALQSLRLETNKIYDVTWLPQLSKSLTDLSLLNNSLFNTQELSNALRPFAESLTSLDIMGNQFTEIPDLSFFTELDVLDFTDNKISDPQSGHLPATVSGLALDYNFLPVIHSILSSLPSLRSIQMTYNVITEIRATDIPVWIEDVKLGYNLITELTDTSFPENSSILSLDLVSNPIVKMSEFAFKNLKRLSSLNMQNSKLTRLPLALTSLTSLSWFDIDGSQDLVCTCMEKGVGSWFLSRLVSIGGSYGETTIYSFFLTLSQACP